MAASAGRIFLISKNFWPVSGETELLAAAFAEKLSEVVDRVDIITWRMIRQWPDRFLFGKCQVIRLPQSHRTSWSPAALGYYGRNRWHRSLQRWAASESKHYDAGIVFEFDGDGMVPTIIAGKTQVPLVSRVQPKLVAGLSRTSLRDLNGLQSSSVSSPAAFVTPDQDMLMSPLAATDGPLAGLTLIADGQPDYLCSSTVRSADQSANRLVRKKAAREILGSVHPIFKLGDQAKLLVCGAELAFESGVFSLVRAWRRVIAAHPDARLWLIGTGRNTPELYQRVCDLDLQHSILLTGNFDDVSDVLSAADAFVLPGIERPGWYAQAASQLGLTIIQHRDGPAIDPAGSRTILFDDETRSIDLVLSRWGSSRDQATSDASFTERAERADRLALPADLTESNERVSEKTLSTGVSIAEMVDRYLSMIQLQKQSAPN